ncbi:MAG: hypothetical protein Q9186_000758 [Xanthomendoza sp. 1 TL-2023]
MRTTSFNAQVLAFLAALAAPVAAQRDFYFTFGSSALVIERLDPILNPGGLSGHVHSVIGGNAFGPSMDFETTQRSTCTSVDIIPDKSNYWVPNVYFHKNGKFTLVPALSPKHKVYYKYGANGNRPDLERSEFPKNFRMMAGNSNLRSDDGSMDSPGTQLNWQCHGPVRIEATGFPKGFTSCNGKDVGGLAATMRFPSCWNGQDFNVEKPLAHMSYPINRDGIAGCPEGFQKARFPEIMVEYWLDVSQFDGQYGANEVPWVLSNGDPTGYGFHMDFLNGWEEGVLARAMKTCNPGNTGSPSLDTPQCFGAGSKQEGKAKEACTKQPSVNEDIGLTAPLDKLPGCNPIQAGPGLATKPADCAGGTVAGSTSVPGPSSTTAPSNTATTAELVGTTTAAAGPAKPQTTTLQSVTPTTNKKADPSPTDTNTGSTSGGSSSGLSPPSVNSTSGVWKAAGCFLDALNPRSLGRQPQWWGQQISTSNCVEYCDSIHAKYAGTENGGQCFCGNELLNSVSHPGRCTAKCIGDKSEICGGPAHLSIYSLDGSVSIKKLTRHRHSRHLKAAI